jgi:hypothetical protein
LVEATIGCKLRFDQPANQFIFDRHWMNKPAKQPDNVRRHGQAVRRALGRSFVAHRGCGKIRASLLQDIATQPTFAATARQLGTTTPAPPAATARDVVSQIAG